MVVLLPAPFGPINAITSPFSILKLKFLTALIVLYLGLNIDLILPFKPFSFNLTLNVFD